MRLDPVWFQPHKTHRIPDDRGWYARGEEAEFIQRCLLAADQVGVVASVERKPYGILEIQTGPWAFATKVPMPRPRPDEKLLWGAWLGGHLVQVPESELRRTARSFAKMIREVAASQGWKVAAEATGFGVALCISYVDTNVFRESAATVAALAIPPHDGYPWDEWCDGDEWVIRRGEDFDCTPKSMVGHLRQMAYSSPTVRRYGKNDVVTRRRGDEITFRFQRTVGLS